jgi:hypothetical protein
MFSRLQLNLKKKNESCAKINIYNNKTQYVYTNPSIEPIAIKYLPVGTIAVVNIAPKKNVAAKK